MHCMTCQFIILLISLLKYLDVVVFAPFTRPAIVASVVLQMTRNARPADMVLHPAIDTRLLSLQVGWRR